MTNRVTSPSFACRFVIETAESKRQRKPTAQDHRRAAALRKFEEINERRALLAEYDTLVEA